MDLSRDDDGDEFGNSPRIPMRDRDSRTKGELAQGKAPQQRGEDREPAVHTFREAGHHDGLDNEVGSGRLAGGQATPEDDDGGEEPLPIGQQDLDLAGVGHNSSPLKAIKFKSSKTNELREKLAV